MADAAKTFELPADVAQAVKRGERVMVTGDGVTLAAIVPLEDLRRLQELEAEEDRQDVDDAERIMAEARARGEEPAPFDQVLNELGLTRAELSD
jgi:antitoxin (DNA-binding transcriptional repressor) of toxin-antitoxin stability system